MENENKVIEFTEDDLDKVVGGTGASDLPDDNGPYSFNYRCQFCNKVFWYNVGNNKRAWYAGYAYNYHMLKHQQKTMADNLDLTRTEIQEAIAMFDADNYVY